MSLIPNLITLLNLLSGALALLFALHPMGATFGWPPMVLSALCIAFGAIFDLLDGMVARALGVSSPLGRELDSLADLVTFGLAPSAIYAHILLAHYGEVAPLLRLALVVGALFLALMSAYRLALFNVGDGQHHHFIGLPTPSSALIAVGVALQLSFAPHEPISFWLSDWRVLLSLVLVQGLLLVAPVHLISFKGRPARNITGLAPYLLLVLGGVSALWCFGWLSPSIFVLLYVLICLFFQRSIARQG